jgi:hypothetical protein
MENNHEEQNSEISRRGRIAIAACAIIYQSGSSIDGATVSFAQITENMERMPWLHAVVEAAGDRIEGWFCFERRIFFQKRINGEVRCQDDQTIQVYEPNANTLTVSRGTPEALAGMGRSALDFPRSIIKFFEDSGEKVIQEKGKYNGRDVNLYKMSGFLGGMDMKIEMTVDAQKNILLFLNQKAFDKAGKLTIEANGYFDYPETGPESIYDVGVPMSAKTVRGEKEEEKTAHEKAFEEAIAEIDARQKWPEPRDLVARYWQTRNAKNFDEMAILWPGSATWNRQVLEKEEAVEYVFGKVQVTKSEDYVLVPYATKEYYEKHGTYSLKMVLSNRKSEKKRYYIVSGN